MICVVRCAPIHKSTGIDYERDYPCALYAIYYFSTWLLREISNYLCVRHHLSSIYRHTEAFHKNSRVFPC